MLIPNEVVTEDGWCVLYVDAAYLAHAEHHLHQYELERVQPRATLPALPHHPGAWRGALVYAAVLVAVVVAGQWLPQNLFDSGALDVGRVQAGQWWRAWTALTLHWDAEHLFGNLAAGALFGYFAAEQLGNGRAWLLIVLGAGGANLLEAAIETQGFVSAGASTAIFTAVGLIAAYSWCLQRRFTLPRGRRVAPILGGLMLLAWLGTEGEHTDVLAHALGFAAGTVLGAAAAAQAVARLLNRLPQAVAAGAALAWLLLCWLLALRP